jgi:membrane protein implicated in regulation of membrane protease activity
MPILPLIDLLILVAWSALFVAFVEKAAVLTVHTRLHLFGMRPLDWVLFAGVCLLFALALAARVWLKAAEPGLLRARRERVGRGGEVLPDFPDPREPLAPAEREPAPALLVRRAAGG